ncbi:hypothetical protein CLAFUW4_03397 [Fulvia fulva]|uniref:Uncharacterized protein n=1 Tax=Passalora fulva TaxID=5499 RepID=A0A9Q8LB48_PASFU|nr:uncharacterized protein CLAFUR5_03377 [Fulvia fulva]KAK4632349.1 hypothetical protein CLAFUR4_03386 [Fulvia fulva]KAK4633425.1 hypothetical protein CLAFUR0_03391 [Fulvia fulva]UJO14182.1 hypothetical protein CLAFUR5_03377 [Fulvia fulva]WPV10881.1 hypothetical protein CLAFUW4_03397 [Fulvia fulva]WPV26678.1 hypothetical protein CLAFUW7_03389 [Fulvia fulva]
MVTTTTDDNPDADMDMDMEKEDNTSIHSETEKEKDTRPQSRSISTLSAVSLNVHNNGNLTTPRSTRRDSDGSRSPEFLPPRLRLPPQQKR